MSVLMCTYKVYKQGKAAQRAVSDYIPMLGRDAPKPLRGCAGRGSRGGDKFSLWSKNNDAIFSSLKQNWGWRGGC